MNTYIQITNKSKPKKVLDYYFWAMPLIATLVTALFLGIALGVYLYFFHELPMSIESVTKPVVYLAGG